MRKHGNPIVPLSLLAMVLAAGEAHAEPSPSDRATARALADEGGEALDEKNYETAIDRFSRADALVHAPTLLLDLARAHVGLGQLLEAQEVYLRIQREGVAPGAPASFARALADAQRESKALAPRFGWVTLSVDGPSAPSVTVDGAPVPAAALGVKRAVNPGAHRVEARAGRGATERAFTVEEGQTAVIALSLEPDAAPGALPRAPDGDPPSGPAGSSQGTLGLITLSIGGAGLVVGSIAGVAAMQRHAELEASCPTGRCAERARADLDAFRSASTISTVGFVIGGAGVIGGAVLLLTKPSDTRASVDAYLGWASAGARVRF